MALPVANGQSWITSSLNSSIVSLTLPVPEIYSYTASLGDYGECGLASDYSVQIHEIGSSSVTLSKSGSSILMGWSVYTTTHPGLIDRLLYQYNGAFRVEIETVNVYFGFTTASGERTGLMVNKATGSPALTLEPLYSPISVPLYRGDVWYESGSIRFMDFDRLNVVVSESALAARHGYSIGEIAPTYYSGGMQMGKVVGAPRIYTDQWYVTSYGTTGIKNDSWNGGIHMPNSGTVSVWGSHKFQIPYGSGSAEGITFYGANNQVHTSIGLFGNVGIIGSLFTRVINFSGSSVNLNITGLSASAMINNAPMTTLRDLSGDVVTSSVAYNGEFYLFRDTGSMYIRANNNWYRLFQSGAYDDGTY
jgi:hypothetical protein